MLRNTLVQVSLRWLVFFLCVLVLIACDPERTNANISDVSHEVVPLNADTFNIEVDNPNHVDVGARFNVRIYRFGEPSEELITIYAGPRNKRVHTVQTGGCGEPPEGVDPSECDLRVTATLLETYWHH